MAQSDGQHELHISPRGVPSPKVKIEAVRQHFHCSNCTKMRKFVAARAFRMAAARSNLHHVLFFDCDVNFFWRENTIFGAENQKFRLRRD